MSLEIKAKILDMNYNRENNLFQLIIQDIQNNKQTGLAIKGTDWGITPDVPQEVIDHFCNEMKGKEKNLFIEVDSSIRKGITKEEYLEMPKNELDKMYDNLNDYPINEVKNLLKKDLEKNED